MLTNDAELLGFSDARSEIEQKIKALAHALVAAGSNKLEVIHALAQITADLCLEDDEERVQDKLDAMRHAGRALFAIAQEVDDRTAAIQRSRAVGLVGSTRN